MEWIEFKGEKYPKFQSEGNAAQFVLPFAKQFCKGVGYDIGYGKEEWKLPGAQGIDLVNGQSAESLPAGKVNYIFSSHCLEHVDDWVKTLLHWTCHLYEQGVIFLYLPDHSQKYWRPWHNRKHKHCFTPEIIKSFFEDLDFNVLASGCDLNNSFVVVAQKRN